MEKAVFAGGCFWCTEAVFESIRGVQDVISGYVGGKLENPSYESVSTGSTGHVEAIQINFDSEKISYSDLLYIFFKMHDPTTKDAQGADVGSQYKSAIFYVNESQKSLAERAIMDAQKDYTSPIVTEILPLTAFYEAEDYHQNYYENNKNVTYCRLVIDPKIQKLKANFGEYLKK